VAKAKVKAKAAVKTVKAKKAKATAGVKKVAKKAKGKANSAFSRALEVSKELAAVIGNKPVPRTEVVKNLWAYIKKHKLQDAKNKRMINADEKLRAVFGKASADMFEMTKLVSKHLK